MRLTRLVTRVGALLGLAIAPLGAQATGAIAGSVVDSMAGVPLTGAVVQAVAVAGAGSAGSGGTAAARTDSTGAYRLEGLAPGRYYVGFQHRRLEELGLREPVRLTEVRAGDSAVVMLAIPSAPSLMTAVCAPAPGDVSGLVIGRVRDAASRAPLADARVAVMWVETRVDGDGRQQVRREQTVPTDSGGRYALCGVPTDVPVAVLARAGERASGLVPVPIEARGVAVRDLALGGVGARLAGVVYFSTGAPYDGATVVVHGTTARDTTGRGGQFDFRDLPAGTQTLLVHAMGYEPRRVAVQLAPGRTDTVAVVLGERTPRIERAMISGSRPRSALEGFARRRIRGLGYSIDSTEIAAAAPRSLAELLRNIPEVRIDYNLFDESIRVDGCAPHVWLDGAYVRGGAEEISYLMDTRLLGGVELFPSLARTPREFVRIGAAHSMGGNCGALLVWTQEVLR